MHKHALGPRLRLDFAGKLVLLQDPLAGLGRGGKGGGEDEKYK